MKAWYRDANDEVIMVEEFQAIPAGIIVTFADKGIEALIPWSRVLEIHTPLGVIPTLPL